MRIRYVNGKYRGYVRGGPQPAAHGSTYITNLLKRNSVKVRTIIKSAFDWDGDITNLRVSPTNKTATFDFEYDKDIAEYYEDWDDAKADTWQEGDVSLNKDYVLDMHILSIKPKRKTTRRKRRTKPTQPWRMMPVD